MGTIKTARKENMCPAKIEIGNPSIVTKSVENGETLTIRKIVPPVSVVCSKTGDAALMRHKSWKYPRGVSRQTPEQVQIIQGRLSTDAPTVKRDIEVRLTLE